MRRDHPVFLGASDLGAIVGILGEITTVNNADDVGRILAIIDNAQRGGLGGPKPVSQDWLDRNINGGKGG